MLYLLSLEEHGDFIEDGRRKMCATVHVGVTFLTVGPHQALHSQHRLK